MARILSSSFTNTLAGLTMNVVELYKISATGMSTFTYTDSNSKLYLSPSTLVGYAGLTYAPYPIKRNKISFSTDLKIDQTEVILAKNWGIDNAIVKDILGGASIQIIRVNADLPDEDRLLLFDGEIADTNIDEQDITLRCQTLDFLNLELPKREFQVACNWQLYDEFCNVILSDFTLGLTTENLNTTTRNIISAPSIANQSDDYYLGGYVQSNSGTNSGLKRHISSHIGQTVTVTPPFPFDFELTDDIDVIPGCDHSIVDCEVKFDILINYGGYPWIPNQDSVL